MRGRISQNLPRRLLGIPCDNLWKQSCNVGYADFSACPCADNFGNSSQSKAGRDPLCESGGRLRIHRTQRCTNRLPANPEPASFITKIWSPAADAEHRT